MLPKSKVNKAAASVVKKRGRKAKRKSLPPNPPADAEEVSGEVEEQSMKELMKDMGAMLHSLNARMGMMEHAAASHAMYTAPPDGCSMQTTSQVATPPAPMVAEMHAPLPDVSDMVRAQVTQCL